MVFCQFLNKIERSVSLILDILGILGHFRHLFIWNTSLSSAVVELGRL